MAKAQDHLDIDDLQETFLECPVCVEHFNQTDRRPRLLHTCLHAFCTPCLEKLLQKDGRGQVTCPVCRHVEKIRGKANSLRVDPVRSKLIDYLQMKQKKGILCTECNKNTAVAISQCKECKSFLCKQCDFVHRNHRVSRGHTILSLDDVMKQPLKSLSRGHFCEIHPQHQIEFYCSTEGKLCCVSCTVLDHKGHDLQKLSESAENKKQDLIAHVQKIQQLKQDLKNAKLEGEKQRKTIIDTKAKSVADIESMFADILTQITERKRQLIAEVIEKSTTLSTIVDKNVKANEQTLATLESAETYFTQAVLKSDDVEMLQMYPSIKRSMTGLGTPQGLSDFESSIQDFMFQNKMVNDVAPLVPQLGIIGVVTKADGIASVKGKEIHYKVFKADITRMHVDVIVNGANSRLSHGGGVARAIAAVAGPALRQESDTVVTRDGKIPVTQLAVTTSGRLSCKAVFHAVGPKWQDYTDKEQCVEDLCFTILRCLSVAVKKGFQSIAFPGISSAIDRVPKDLCAKAYIRALKSFELAATSTSLREVNFVDITAQMVHLIQTELQNTWHLPADREIYSRDKAFIDQCFKQNILNIKYYHSLD